jgi:glutathione S-transferase
VSSMTVQSANDMLVYYDSSYSTCPRKGRMALEEKGVEYEKVEVDYFDRESEFWREHGLAVLPVVKHRGEIIRESTVICEYVDEAFDGPPLMPSDPVLRARARLWMKRVEVEIHVPHHLAVNYAVVFGPDLRERGADLDEYLETTIPSRRPIYRDTIERGFDSQYVRDGLAAYDALFEDMENELARTPWLAGDEFSLADIGAAPWALRIGHEFGFSEVLWDGRPHIADWFERLSARDGFKRAVYVPGSDGWIEDYARHGAKALPDVARIVEELRREDSGLHVSARGR